MCDILAFVGSGATPGRTTLAWNIAAALGRLGFTVTIADAGNNESGLGSYLGIEPRITIGDWLLEEAWEDHFAVPVGERVSFAMLGETACTVGEISFARLTELSRRLAESDFLILDFAPGTVEDRLPLIESASEVYAVVTPDQVAGTEALFYVSRLYRSSGLEKISLILNRAPLWEIAEIISNRLEHDLRRILRVPARCIAHVPEDPLIPLSMQSKMSLLEYAPESVTSERLLEIAQTIAKSRTERGVLTWLLGFVRALVLSFQLSGVTETASDPRHKQQVNAGAGPDGMISLVAEALQDLSERPRRACMDFPGLSETARTLS